ncbi:hypothetical protein NBE98_05135 [Clostridium swellfunianum]|uniref:hypothetical protein n=1 Tax=Clostridium swellfunianum TaxID=1367462 RepID=UPI00203005D8|nr:hypothetical protein [Clostridium swellfunianum]MCM0647760.1 hypothetical protein [Clostridium swellfunianum]
MDENKNPVEQNLNITNEQKVEGATSSSDISKVKIVSVLKHRFKNMKPGFKKAIPLILVGIICFAAGIGVDRAFIGRRINRNFKDRPGINQKLPNNPNMNKQNGKNNDNSSSRGSQKQ